MVTDPSAAAAEARTRIPVARYPSSFVQRIFSGRSTAEV